MIKLIRQQSLADQRLISRWRKGNPVIRYMERYKQLLGLIGILACSDGLAQSQLRVQVEGITQVKGQVLYSLFRTSDGFPDDAKKAFKRGAIPVNGRSVDFYLESLPVGDYAMSLVHDRNGNGRLDVNGLGVPTEEIGFSNNVMGAFGPPKFNRARFIVRAGKQDLSPIRMKKVP